jgi:peptide/nickel transport system permease protein
MTIAAAKEAFRPLTLAEKFGLIGVVALTLVSASARLLVPFDPQARVAGAYLAPSLTHWFGTDEIGRDLFSRVLLGTQYTWLPALALVTTCAVFGTLIAIIPVVVSARFSHLVKSVVDFFLILPGTLVALAVIATLGPGLKNTIIAIGVAWWPWYSRIAIDEVQRLMARPSVEAARLAGVGRFRMTVRYVLPGAFPALLVAASLDVSNVIMTISLVSFLGLGQPAPAPELGAMTSRALDSLTVFWWLPMLPAAALFLICFLSNLAGDGIRATLRGA